LSQMRVNASRARRGPGQCAMAGRAFLYKTRFLRAALRACAMVSARRRRYAGRMKLHSYFRSSAAYRVRIALHLLDLPFDYVPVHLLRGEQREPGYVARAGDALVPALELDDGTLLAQSMAIIEYLQDTHPGA